ncbi:MAG: hypothetical protein KGI71_04050 [Patescibacteria group bacterium]|nr:hypothetical protein [Patescibacteria group bacterium]
MPRCLDCAHITTHGESGKRLAALGYVGCTQKSAGITRSIVTDMDCPIFQQASAQALERNRLWAVGNGVVEHASCTRGLRAY